MKGGCHTERISLMRRYLTGAPLTGGYLGSSATRRPGWQHQLMRVGPLVAAAAADAAYVANPTATVETAALVGSAAAAMGGPAARRAWRTRKFRRAYTRPTLAALKGTLGDAPVQLDIDPGLGNLIPRLARPMSPAEVATRKWYGRRVEPVVRWLPERTWRATRTPAAWSTWLAARVTHFRAPREEKGPCIELRASVPFLTAEQRQYVSAVIGAKVPAGDLVESWDQVGAAVKVTWTVRRRPPASVGYADLAARFDGLREWEFFVGLGVGGKPVTISLRDDSPHIACSAGSGAGKSVLAALIAAQVLARGGQVVILDLKGSHRWALGTAGVDYCTTAEQMSRALVRLAELADRRNTDALHEAEDWDPGQRTLIIAEEMNATFAQLRDYWADVREKGEPKVPPAVKAFRRIMFMGRSAKINIFGVAQMLSAQTTGGPESRENFGIRCLARYSKNAWQMLVPEAAMPRSSRTLGRWQIVVGGVSTETQVCYLKPAEIRVFVAGRTGVSMSQSTSQSPLTSRTAEMSQQQRHISLREAARCGAVPWGYHASRKRLERARKAGRSVPAPVRREGMTDVYVAQDLASWAESEVTA